MPFAFVNLDARTRECMLAEFELDRAAGSLFFDARLNEMGRLRWPAILHEALAEHDDGWLAERLRGLLSHKERVRRPMTSEYYWRQIADEVRVTIAEGEFNRYYVRAICARALAEGVRDVEVYRARASGVPRPASDERIGARVSCEAVLADLRKHGYVEPALGVPGGPNSGISVRLPHEMHPAPGPASGCQLPS